MRDETKKKILSFTTLTFVVAFAVSLGWGLYQYQLVKEFRTKTENQYKQAFNDMVTALNEVETSMSKAKVATTPEQKALFMGETWKGCEDVVSKLGQMPADEIGINYVDTIMNQIGDFSKIMTRKAAAGNSMAAQDQNMFSDMHERVIEVNRSVQELSNLVYSENLAWVDKKPGVLQRLGLGQNQAVQTAAQGEENAANEKQNQGEQQQSDQQQGDQQANQQANQQVPASVRDGLNQLDASLQKYPPFTYQGQLDKHFVEEPLGLPSGEIDESKAAATAKDFLSKVGYNEATPQAAGLSEGPLGGFVFNYKDVFLEVTQKGGAVIHYRDQREIGDRQLDEGQVSEKALGALKQLGWEMVITSTQDFGSYYQIDAVSEIDQVRIYPDKVRLTIATDNGQLIGFDPSPYYSYSHKRDLTPQLTLDQARAKLDRNFKVLESRMAVVAKHGTEEALCYEFRGNAYGEEYLIYIHALAGNEEKINRVINTPRGKLIQ